MLLRNFGYLACFAQSVARIGILVSVLSGCAAIKPLTEQQAPGDARVQGNDVATVDTSLALHCMDNLLSDYGVRDVSILVEDLADPDRQFGGGNREMLVSVLSELARRSAAIRLVTPAKNWGNTANVLAEASRRAPLALAPQFALRGSFFSQARRTVVGVYLALLATSDMTLVPGMSSRNTVRMLPGGRAEIYKLGMTFPLAASDEPDALGQLLQLSSIELIGRLARVPYWTCPGSDGSNLQVAAEQQNWYDAMASEPVELIRYFQRQMRLRHVNDGPLDVGVNEPFKQSVAAYRAAFGLSSAPKLSQDFFQAYLAADHHQLGATVARNTGRDGQGISHAVVGAQLAARPNALGSVTANAKPSLSLELIPANTSSRYAAAEPVRFVVKPSRAAHIYCFLHDEQGQIVRFFPNRFQLDSRVTTDGLQLPGPAPYQIRMNHRSTPETVACYAADGDVLPKLSGGLNAGDFTPLPATNLAQVRDAFTAVSDGAIAHETLLMQPR